MHTHTLDEKPGSADSYLFGRRQAWFAFAMTIALMVFDYVDPSIGPYCSSTKSSFLLP